MKIPSEWMEEIEIGNLMIRSKPYSDKETLQPICNRCANANMVVLSEDKCSTCYHTFVRSLISFDFLTLVEFKLEKGNLLTSSLFNL